MFPFDSQDPPACFDIRSQGRTRISQGLHNIYALLNRSDESISDNFPVGDSDQNSYPDSTFQRRKTGHKHRAKRSRDFARRTAQSQFDEDIFDPLHQYKQSNRTPTTGAPMSPSARSSNSGTASDAQQAFDSIMDFKRSRRQRSRCSKIRLPDSESDEYTNALHTDLTRRALRTRHTTNITEASAKKI